MNYDDLIKEAKVFAEQNYLNKEKLSNDEQLQLLSCGYAVLFLSACANKSAVELGRAHEYVAQCFKKIGDQSYSDKHLKVANGYSKI